MKRDIKVKHELGTQFPFDFYYPEVFFKPRPTIVPGPWRRMEPPFYARAIFETPLRKLKRKFLRGKSGY